MKSKAEIISDYCAKFKDTPSRTLARTIYGKHGHLWEKVEDVYQSVRYRRGNHGRAKRNHAGVIAARPNGDCDFKWKFPTSSAEAWHPVRIDAGRTLILSDLHIPFHDTKAIQAAVEVGIKDEVDCITLNGDVCDFFSISRFDKNPTKSSLKKEIDLTRQFLGWLRDKFKKARIIYKFGNHDEWFDKYLWRKAPEMFGIPEISLAHLLTE